MKLDRVMQLEHIKQLAASHFGYTQYFDDYNKYRLIKPKNSNKALDKFLDPYADEVILNSNECLDLSVRLGYLATCNPPSMYRVEQRGEATKLNNIINRLGFTLYLAGINELTIKINNDKEELSYDE
ncbi:hypothetical protein [Apilactobacillus timberlakei]|uniref:Uncharacterized protein n=1 Tax=Apilactobacillus timberlakei TaxID=2008380 RepID=A0ABY2YR62_9LACO|nr:hypothetical protein [Apilactobacillus timberlakei]TPR12422.1 hypothetical protein DY048_07680 [Apilactobacillus timberlakei]TPR12962.1 hypothetical protein DY052_08600 [Apilactobacillus timberlakei]